MESLKTIEKFIDRINRGNVQGITEILATEHTYIDVAGQIEKEFDRIIESWKTFLHTHKNFRIYIRQVYEIDDSFALLGHTTGSHQQLSDEVEFHTEGKIWLAKVENNKLSYWQIFSDSIDNTEALKLQDSIEHYIPHFFAATIAKHLDLLPEGSRMRDVRDVRVYYSHLYRNAPPQVILAIAENLIFQQGYRLIPYELIYFHPGTIELLTPQRVEEIGKGINDSSSTDMFARYIAGPAWLNNILSEDILKNWIESSDAWWRRAALVSTIYLHGDVDHMFDFCQRVIQAREDSIVKAISWVLREAIRYDQSGVIDFLTENEEHLAPRIKVEVGLKLSV